jgi:hypothetical protein
VKLDDNTQLMDHKFSIFPITKGDNNTYPAVTVVSVTCSGDRHVDNKPGEGCRRGLGIEGQNLAVEVQLLIYFGDLKLNLCKLLVNFGFPDVVKLTLARTKPIGSSIIPLSRTNSCGSIAISLDSCGVL